MTTKRKARKTATKTPVRDARRAAWKKVDQVIRQYRKETGVSEMDACGLLIFWGLSIMLDRKVYDGGADWRKAVNKTTELWDDLVYRCYERINLYSTALNKLTNGKVKIEQLPKKSKSKNVPRV